MSVIKMLLIAAICSKSEHNYSIIIVYITNYFASQMFCFSVQLLIQCVYVPVLLCIYKLLNNQSMGTDAFLTWKNNMNCSHCCGEIQNISSLSNLQIYQYFNRVSYTGGEERI